MPPLKNTDCHILLVNPNSSSSMTAELSTLYSGIPHITLSYLDGSRAEAALLLPFTLDYIAHTPVDGILVCCFSDHPLVPMLRENVDIPIMGIFHASLQAASALDRRFGIVTTAKAWHRILTSSVLAAGAQNSCVGVIATGLGVLELESRPRDEVLVRIQKCTSTLIDRGANCIVLGCAGMAPLERLLKDILPNEIKIIDGVRYGIHFLAALASI